MFNPTQNNGQNFLSLHKYQELPQKGKIQCEYVWIGGSGNDIRSKTKTLPHKISSISQIPCWNYDGSSTGQAKGHYSEIFLRPVKFIPDPFRRGDNIICLCECLDAATMKAIPTNNRSDANQIFTNKKVINEEPWYGIEQEYTLFDKYGTTPLGWPGHGYPAPQGPYYCGNGANYMFGRQIAEAHYKACLFCGLDISGINAEVMPGQWEFQIGPSNGIDAADQLWLARFILARIAEEFGVVISYEPKPIKGDWNGAGAHHNYSTKSMRSQGGYKYIMDAIKKLSKVHDIHMAVYGDHNGDRLTGKHETAKYNEFKYGVGNRGASIRIPRQSEIDQKGYLEDRRPAANCDPYAVTSIIAKTTLLSDE